MADGGAVAPEPTDRREAILREVDAGIAAGPFSADWESLAGGYQVPDWYVDGKFGIFIHWGPYSCPGLRQRVVSAGDVPGTAHPRSSTTGPPSAPHDRFGYKDFIPDFTGAAFDPAQWAALFRRAGAQFVVPVAEHHDGFAMYDTGLSRWNAARMGPRRDVVGSCPTRSAPSR